MKKHQLGCGYEGHEFGAHYPDGRCIDGFMWDLDSGGVDDDGQSYLDHGGDLPCPKCNLKRRIKYLSDEINDRGYESITQPLSTKDVKNAYNGLPSNARRMALRHWRRGRREAIRDAKREG